uniref:Retrovirus-related Pol polyprotein from transposon opus n=1 Tax=Cajanus cajan TaxID=3821 RepID=A0A151SJM1_CAJCA|nr:Retrovirus-related Pol polyprotein from transposon opus [Cajanus cajan]
MRLMNHILRYFIGKFVVVYFDDILVYRKILNENLGHLRQVLIILRDNHLYANFEKCIFCQDQVNFLRFIVGKEGVYVDPKKIKAIQDWPGNTKTWDDYLPHIEFSYDKVVYKTTNLSPFEVVYGFNPLTHVDLLPLPNTTSLFYREGVSRVDFVKKYHQKFKSQIKKQTQKYAKYNTKGREKVYWLHLRKVRFPTQRMSKLSTKGDGPFQVLQKIDDNENTLDLPSDYEVSSSFNVCHLTLFVRTNDKDELEDLRSNPSQERGNDGRPPLELHMGSITRFMTRRVEKDGLDTMPRAMLIMCVEY